MVHTGRLCALYTVWWLCNTSLDWTSASVMVRSVEIECPSGFYFSKETDAFFCRACDVCPSGYKTTFPCSANANTQCSACAQGYYSADSDIGSTCRQCTRCEAGSYMQRPCTEDTDTVCTPCKEGTFSSRHGHACTPCRTCSEGEYERRECTTKRNTLCRLCRDNSYSPEGKECHTCISCPPGSGQTSLCTRSSDAKCEECPVRMYSPGGQASCRTCSVCQETQTVISNCTSFKDTVCFPCLQGYFFHNSSLECKKCTSCREGTIPQKECTETNDIVCAECPDGTFALSSPEGMTCANCSTCPAGWRATSACTMTSDTLCHRCPHGTFLAPDGKDCLQCTYCPAGLETKRECTSKRDTTCRKCDRGYYSPGHGFSCRVCSLCPPGHFVFRKCSRRRDSVCRPCSEGTYTETWSSLPDCYPCSTCQPPQAVLRACYIDSNVQCGFCGPDSVAFDDDATCHDKTDGRFGEENINAGGLAYEQVDNDDFGQEDDGDTLVESFEEDSGGFHSGDDLTSEDEPDVIAHKANGQFVDTKTKRCMKCSYCHPNHLGEGVKEEGCWREHRDWQCRPLTNTTNMPLTGEVIRPKLAGSSSSSKDVKEYAFNLDDDNIFQFTIIVVPAVVVLFLITMVIGVWIFVRRHKSSFHRQSTCTKTPLDMTPSTVSDVKSWLSKQQITRPLSSSASRHSWPMATVLIAEGDDFDHMAVVSYSALSRPDVQQRLEERLSDDCRLYPKPFPVPCETDSFLVT